MRWEPSGEVFLILPAALSEWAWELGWPASARFPHGLPPFPHLQNRIVTEPALGLSLLYVKRRVSVSSCLVVITGCGQGHREHPAGGGAGISGCFGLPCPSPGPAAHCVRWTCVPASFCGDTISFPPHFFMVQVPGIFPDQSRITPDPGLELSRPPLPWLFQSSHHPPNRGPRVGPAQHFSPCAPAVARALTDLPPLVWVWWWAV